MEHLPATQGPVKSQKFRVTEIPIPLLAFSHSRGRLWVPMRTIKTFVHNGVTVRIVETPGFIVGDDIEGDEIVGSFGWAGGRRNPLMLGEAIQAAEEAARKRKSRREGDDTLHASLRC